MKNKISIIIPIYNVEQYLARCLDSVINQTYKNLEIICVNDCSPDNSINILEEYSQKDNRIKIIQREKNGGLSAARNTGLNNTTGEYIYFIDSDDWIDLDYIEKMVKVANESKSNIVVNTNIKCDYNNTRKSEELYFGNLKISEEGQKINSNIAINNITWSVCTHLYKRSFLEDNKLRFPEGYTYEDMFFSPKAFSCTSSIFAFMGSRYHYFIRDNSICRNKTSEYIQKAKFLSIFNMVFDYLLDKKYIDKYSCLLYPSNFIIPSQQCINTDIFEQIQKYFLKIEKYVRRDKELYEPIEFEFFEDVITNIEKAKTINYAKRALFYKLRNNIKKGNK